MEHWSFKVLRLWRVSLLYASVCALALQFGCVHCLNEEGQLLLNWKQAHLDDPHGSLSNWNALDATPCFWAGVQCAHGSISGLNLSPYGSLGGAIDGLTFEKFANLTSLHVGDTMMSGSFPRDIVNCSKLVYLNLSGTLISGEVPTNIIKLRRMQVLDLSFADLVGTFENRIGELQELRVLRLAGNQFEGEMPQSILSLMKLQELALSDNNWNGTIPMGFFAIPNLKALWLGSNIDLINMVPWPNFTLWQSLEELSLEGVRFPKALFPTEILKMTNLKMLFLVRCNITGPLPSLANLTHLEKLHLGEDNYNGEIPDMFGSMPNMTELLVYGNQLTGIFPSSLWRCQKLSSFTVYYTSIDGDLVGIGNLSSLTYLDLGDNYLKGELPASIGSLILLTYINLSNNSLSGAIPTSVGNLTLLTHLGLYYNPLGGQIPISIGNLKLLNFLSLNNNSLTGEIPKSIGNLTLLTFLDFANNNFNGEIPTSVGNLTLLRHLDFCRNNLMGEISTSIWHLTLLTSLYLCGNNFMGAILASIGNLTLLTVLNFANNNFTGGISTSVGNLTLLTVLNLSNNPLGGQIPTSIGNLKLLNFVSLHNNSLTGEIPTSIGNLTLLTYLDFDNNNFFGEIPASIGNLMLLTFLDFANNNFTGEIPAFIGNLTLLKYLVLSNNSMSGEIPSGIVELEALQKLYIDNNQFIGEVPYNLGKNSFLQRIQFGNNRLEGPIPPYLCWANNSTLQLLSCYNNRFTGSIPETYGNCTSLEIIRLNNNLLEGPVPTRFWGGLGINQMLLNGNNLSGSIDARIGMSTNLSILFLQDNIFSGPIPVEIGRISLSKFRANANKLNGTLPSTLGNLSNLTELTLGANSFNGTIPTSLGECSELVLLDLSRNHLDGAIPNELAALNKLSILDLSENKLTGAIPKNFFSIITLQVLNVAFNNLSGVIPNQGNGLASMVVNFTGNLYLCVEGSCGTNNGVIINSLLKSEGKQAPTVFVAVFVVVAVVLFVAFFLILRRCKGGSHGHVQLSEDKSSWTLTSFHNKIYQEDEITNLNEDNLIGVGGSSKVYKVTLNDGEVVAVKKLWNVKKEGGCGNHGFTNELKNLASIRHRHIVRLLCCCTRQNNNLLVFEYMANGSLGDLMHGSKADALSWEIRYKIAMGVAKGLEYLHHDCSPQMVHRDIKPTNILLDLDYEAHLADFGIAKMVDPTASHDLSLIVGSMGYIPPEYAFGAQVTEKIDIYSFGVVLMELVTGKHANGPSECVDGTNLVQWVHNKVLTQQGLEEVLDSKCGANSKEEMIQVLRVAVTCTNYTPTSRPSMREVVKLLEDNAPKFGGKTSVYKDGGGEVLDDLDVQIQS